MKKALQHSLKGFLFYGINVLVFSMLATTPYELVLVYFTHWLLVRLQSNNIGTKSNDLLSSVFPLGQFP